MTPERTYSRIDAYRTRDAFSIIELVFVIGVLAVLIGLAIPSLGSVRRKGRSTADVVHVRTLMQIVTQYATTYQDMFPTCGGAPGPASASFPYALRLAGLLPREQDAIGRSGQVWQLTATAFIDPKVIKPGMVPPSESVVFSPRRLGDVVFPSGKGILSPVRRLGDGVELTWCCVNDIRGACAFADGSADEYTWSDFVPAEGTHIEMWAGMPIYTTWDGIWGQDKKP